MRKNNKKPVNKTLLRQLFTTMFSLSACTFGGGFVIVSLMKKKVVEERAHMIEDGDLRLDCESRRLFIQEREVNLTGKEFELLELLVRNPNKVYGREKLLNLVWGADYPGDVRTVDVHVRRMREKIEKNPSEPKYVHTKWGVGYYYHG